MKLKVTRGPAQSFLPFRESRSTSSESSRSTWCMPSASSHESLPLGHQKVMILYLPKDDSKTKQASDNEIYHVHQPGARKGHICLRAFRNFIYHGCCMRHALAKTRTFTFHRPASGQTFDKSPVRRVAGSPHVSRGGTVQNNRLIQSVGSPAEFKHKIQTRQRETSPIRYG